MNYSLAAKIKFYFFLAYYNLLSPLECQNHRLKVFINEFRFLFVSFGWRKLKSIYTKKMFLKTIFGNFYIKDIDWDLKVASPSFERLDLNELITLIEKALARGHKVAFIDVGAEFGKFSVAIGHHFKNQAKNIIILAFEPEPDSFKLLKENVKTNILKHAHVFPVALSNK